jgi:hypothetical protein
VSGSVLTQRTASSIYSSAADKSFPVTVFVLAAKIFKHHLINNEKYIEKLVE